MAKRHLTLLDAACVIVGIIIGSGIYETTPRIAAEAGHPGLLAAVWVAGAVVALAGAFCYAELSTAFPDAGGDYIFLRRAYGSQVGFLFGWFDLCIMRPANTGAMAAVFARYLHQLIPAGFESPPLAYAVGVVVVIWAFNLLGARPGAWLQNVLTISKSGGLVLVAVAGFVVAYSAGGDPAPQAPPLEVDLAPLGLAFVFVMYSFGGWNDVSFLAGEIKKPEKNLTRALTLGVMAVAAIYLLVNVSLYAGLGWTGLSQGKAVAAEVARRAAGPGGATAVSVLICISCAGAISGMMYAASRMYFALGARHAAFGWLATWNDQTQSPLRVQVLQGLIVLVMLSWSWNTSGKPFESLVVTGAPFFWIFLALVGAALIRLRFQLPAHPRPYRASFYPWSPLLFIAACLYMVHSSATYLWNVFLFTPAGQGSWGLSGVAYWVAGVLAIGLALSFFGDRRENVQPGK